MLLLDHILFRLYNMGQHELLYKLPGPRKFIMTNNTVIYTLGFYNSNVKQTEILL